MTLDPHMRTFRDIPGKKRMREVDGAARGRKIKTLGFALYGGLPLGAAAGFVAGHPFLGTLLGPVIIWSVATVLSGVAGRGVAFLFLPFGPGTLRKTDYSRAEALVVRGEYEAAILAYEEAIRDAPRDGEAYLRIARIFRDHVKRPEEALLWYQRGLEEAGFSRGQEILTRREMAELFIHHLQEPRRAAPDLARLAEEYPDTVAGKWAGEELARVKREIAGGE